MIVINLIQVALIAIWTLVFSYIITLPLTPKMTHRLAVKLWSPVVSFIAMSKIKAEGLENLDPDKHYIFMANHASFFDVPALFWASRRELHFMVKKELSTNIFTGYICRKMRMVFIDRGNAARTAASMKQTIELIKEGMDIGICPEGTRTRTGNLGAFHKGGFKLAINSQIDIVPVTIKNSAKAWSRNNIRFHPTTVTVHFGKPVSVQGMEESQANELAKEVRGMIEEELKR